VGRVNDNQEIRYLGDVQKLTLGEGDIVVISVDDYLSQEAAEHIKRHVSGLLDGRKVLVLGKGMKIGVLSEKDAA
jgi:hypothetical protein